MDTITIVADETGIQQVITNVNDDNRIIEILEQTIREVKGDSIETDTDHTG